MQVQNRVFTAGEKDVEWTFFSRPARQPAGGDTDAQTRIVYSETLAGSAAVRWVNLISRKIKPKKRAKTQKPAFRSWFDRLTTNGTQESWKTPHPFALGYGSVPFDTAGQALRQAQDERQIARPPFGGERMTF
jgi:hypothetical protein